MRSKFILIVVLLSNLNGFSQEWISQSKELLNNHYYQKSINLVNNNINKNELSSIQKSNCYQILADNYLHINDLEKFKKFSTLSFNILDNKTALDSSLYYSNLSNYYHYLLQSKDATHYAVVSLKLLTKDFAIADSSLISRIFSTYGNSMRNAIFHYSNIHKTEEEDSLIFMRKHSVLYLKKALQYANKWQKPDVLRRLGTTYNDMFARSYNASLQNQTIIGTDEVFKDGFEFFHQAIDLGKSTYQYPNRFLSQCYALLALNYHYLKKYHIADSLYNISINYTLNNNKIIHLYEYNASASWRGWNYEEWYKSSNDIQYLYKSLATYESSVKNWFLYNQEVSNKNKGLDDAYRVSTFHKIPNNCYTLFKLTNESSYIDKALYYCDLDSYPTYLPKKKTKDTITVKKLQQNLTDDESIVVYLSSYYPNTTHAIVVSKTTVHFLFLNNSRILFKNEAYKNVNGFDSILNFKNSNFGMYNSLFKPIDSLLTLNNAKNIIIVPSPGFSLLNFDLLISDNTQNKWKDFPYMFHKYNFSYSLNLTILNDNYSTKKTNKNTIGIIKSKFNNKPNLLFSDNLTDWICNNYSSTISSPPDLNSFNTEVNKSNIIFLIGHGQGSYSSSNSSIYLNDSIYIDSDYLMNMNFNNQLFITTACNTNQSSTYFSEGATGGFTKALMYSGVKSTLTTNWEIDDKTNKFIMERFIHYLSEGKKKSEALWLSKKDYWNNAKQDEEFSPFYWAAYRLTGNTSPIVIKNKMSFNYYYLLVLLIFPLGIFVKRKWFN